MQLRSRSVIISSLSIAVLFFFAASANPQAVSDVTSSVRPEISFDLVTPAITLHEPVLLLFRVHNTLKHVLKLRLGIDEKQFFQFSLVTPEGTRLDSTPLRTGGFFGGTGIVSVEAGDTYEKKLLLNEWFRFDSGGQYLLTVRLTTPIESAGISIQPPDPFSFHLSIDPRNPARLQAVCSELADAVENAPNANSASEPALQLSYVQDPIAVPYLSRLLHARKLADEPAIAGLERIGTPDAINVLLSALNYKFGDAPSLSRASLMRLQSRVSDPSMKEKILDALASPQQKKP